MNKVIITFSVLIIILITIIYILLKQKKNLLNTEASSCDRLIARKRHELELIDKTLEERRTQLTTIDTHIVEKIEDQRKIIEANLQTIEKEEQGKLRLKLLKEETEQRQLIQERYKQLTEECQLKVQDFENKACEAELHLNQLKNSVADYAARQNAINEEILRQRELQEKEEFFKVQLSEADLEDVEVLQSIRMRLHKIDQLDKLIYDGYIAKPVLEMTKRVLKGSAPSGIYKITRLKTGEIYIGKSTDVKARWQQHAKTSFGVGTIAHSILHTTIEKDGIENFTFELIEEVPKDKLSEREKFYISFYQSKQYGLNEKAGG